MLDLISLAMRQLSSMLDLISLALRHLSSMLDLISFFRDALLKQETEVAVEGHGVNRLTLSFTQERHVTIVDPLGSLNDIMTLTRQRRVSPHQNTSRNTSGDPKRKLTAALTVGKVTNIHQLLKNTRGSTPERKYTTAQTVGGCLLPQSECNYTREPTPERNRTTAQIAGWVLLPHVD
jgi:hypothetical protein